jgi:hypothetical protein
MEIATVYTVLGFILVASSLLLFTIWDGWHINDGGISFGRLNKIQF